MTVCFVPSHVRSAGEIVATERQRTSAERDAFAQFADRIVDLDTSATNSPTGFDQQPAVQMVLQSDTQSDTRLGDARDAYRDTVMSVPHYAEEYDELLEEHITAELSPDVATALTSGDQLLPPLQEQLVTESREAYTSRDIFLNALADEADALQTADEQLTELGSKYGDVLAARSFDGWSSAELTDIHQQLQADERNCEEMALSTKSAHLPGMRCSMSRWSS